MADWSQRPLSKEMLNYAAHDSHFLMHIAKCIIEEVQGIPGQKNDKITEICQ